MRIPLCCLLAAALLAQPAAAAMPVACADTGTLACMNNGTCFEDVREGSYCRCADGFAGSLCELSINSAAPTVCPPPTGVTSLLVGSCLNGGTCPTDAASFCDCSSVTTDASGNTFRGAHCEYPAVKCAGVPLWCYNGGVCVVQNSGNTLCQCPKNFAGGSCQKINRDNTSAIGLPPVQPAAAPPGTVAVPTWVAAPVIIGLVLILILSCMLFYMYKRERRGTPVFQQMDHGAGSLTRRQELTKRISEADGYGSRGPPTEVI